MKKGSEVFRDQGKTQSGGRSGAAGGFSPEWLSLGGSSGRPAQEAGGHPAMSLGDRQVSKQDQKLLEDGHLPNLSPPPPEPRNGRGGCTRPS